MSNIKFNFAIIFEKLSNNLKLQSNICKLNLFVCIKIIIQLKNFKLIKLYLEYINRIKFSIRYTIFEFYFSNKY